MRFFVLNWFDQKNLSQLLITHLKYFLFCLHIRWELKFSCIPHITVPAYAYFHSAYYLNMLNFILHIIGIWTSSFHILSASTKFLLKSNTNSMYSQSALNFISLSYCVLHLIPHIISIWTISFLLISAYAKFCLKSSTHSACYQYAVNFNIRNVTFFS
jgi:hypothetical protein